MSNQALIVFGKNPVPGMVKTRLAVELGDATAAELYQAFLLDTLDRYAGWVADVRLYLEPSVEKIVPGLIETGMPFLRQKGATLGARMSHAFDETFSAGYQRVVIVGSDHPTLPPARITKAFDILRIAGRTVIGPSDDGGYYLIGLSEPAPSLFAGMTYSHSRVLEDTQSRARDADLPTVLLEPWYDVDTMADVQRLLSDPRLGPHVCPRTFVCLAAIGLIENASLV